MKIIYRSRLFLVWPLSAYGAIVLGRRMFTRYSEQELSVRMIRHELVHQEQMDRHGMLMFYILYGSAYIKNLCIYRNHWQAYFKIPFEEEAYRREQEEFPPHLPAALFASAPKLEAKSSPS